MLRRPMGRSCYPDRTAPCHRSVSLPNSEPRAVAFYAFMNTVVDRYFPILDALESELEKIDEQIFLRNTARSNVEAVYALKRSLMILKHAVDPLMEVVSKLYRGRGPQICSGMGGY